MGMHTLKYVFTLAMLYTNVKSQSYNTVKNLKSHIFTNYDKTTRPASDLWYPTLAYVDLVLIGISELDEVAEKLTSTGYLYITWYDEQLTWDPASYEDTEYLYVPQNEIWKPDIQLKNGFQEFKQMGGDFMYVELWYDGTVIWKPFQTFQTKCSIAIRYFPFDTQVCNITFIAWSMTVHDVNITEWYGDIDLYALESNGEWNVVSTKASSTSDTSEAEVTFSLTLKRKPLNILLNLIIPLILLTVLDIFTFMIPVDSGEKISFCMTVFLSFAVFLTIVSDRLPGSSDGLSLLGIYLLTMLAQGCIIIFVTTIQLRLYFRDADQPVPKALKLLSNFAQVLQCRRRPKCVCKSKARKQNEVIPMDIKQVDDAFTTLEDDVQMNIGWEKVVETSKPEGDVQFEVGWKQAVEAMDFFLFLLTLINLMVTTAILCILAINNDN